MDKEFCAQQTSRSVGGFGGAPSAGLASLDRSTLTPSVRALLEENIKRHRDEAFRLEALSRELPDMSHDATRALWDILCAAHR